MLPRRPHGRDEAQTGDKSTFDLRQSIDMGRGSFMSQHSYAQQASPRADHKQCVIELLFQPLHFSQLTCRNSCSDRAYRFKQFLTLNFCKTAK